MKHELKSLLLMQRLIDRLNSECVTISYTLLADYLLTNYHRLESVTVEELCREIFVSKSTVRRFCRAMGYDHFTDLKKAKHQLPLDDYPPGFSVQGELSELAARFSVPREPLERLCALLAGSREVFLLLPENLLSAGCDFQRQMAKRKRLIYIVPNIDRHFALIEKPLQDALVMVLDSHREYTASLLPYLDRISCRKVCIRAGEGAPPPADWQEIFPLGGCQSPVAEKYLYAFFLDTLAAAYQETQAGNVF